MKKYIAGLIFLGFLIIPSVSFGQVSDIDPNPTGSNCVVLQSSGLRYKARDINTNGEVSTLQDFLQAKNYLNSEPTGYFGILTLKAVKDFQKDNGISPTGYVGAITKASIQALTCVGIIGGDKDKNGCIPSAGYSWCQVKNKCLRTWEEKCEITPSQNGCLGADIFSSTTGQRCIPITPVSKSPVISGVSGPQALDAGQQGIWTVNASSPNSGTLSYSVDWGDVVYGGTRSSASTSSQSIQQSATFTHTYNTAGTYNPTFTVTNIIGQSARTSLSVKVVNTITTTPYISNVWSDLAGNATVQGTNLGAVGSNPIVKMNGKTVNSGATGYYVLFSNGTINFKPIDFGVITSGSYSVQIINSSGVYSNIFNFYYTAPTIGDGCSNGEVYSSTTGQRCISITPASKSPVISSISGPQTLNVNQTGTWIVNAYDPNSIAGGPNNLTYSADWGDITQITCQPGAACDTSTRVSQQTATFTHTYNTAGTFTPIFYVTNSSGQSAKTSLSIRIDQTTTPGGAPSTGTGTGTRGGVVGFIPEVSLSANALSALDSKSISQNNSTTDVSTNCSGFTMTLSKGMNNLEVKCLQKLLNAKGFKLDGVSAGEETTYFGYNTWIALKTFQTNSGLVADGIFGSASREALLK